MNTHYLLIKNVYFAGFQKSNYKTSRKPYDDVHESRLAWLEFNFPNYLAHWRENTEARCPELEADVTSRLMLQSQSTEGVFVASLSISAVVMECLFNGASYVLARLVNQDLSLLKRFSDTKRRREGGEAFTIRAFLSCARNFDVLRCSSIPGGNMIEII